MFFLAPSNNFAKATGFSSFQNILTKFFESTVKRKTITNIFQGKKARLKTKHLVNNKISEHIGRDIDFLTEIDKQEQMYQYSDWESIIKGLKISFNDDENMYEINLILNKIEEIIELDENLCEQIINANDNIEDEKKISFDNDFVKILCSNDEISYLKNINYTDTTKELLIKLFNVKTLIYLFVYIEHILSFDILSKTILHNILFDNKNKLPITEFFEQLERLVPRQSAIYNIIKIQSDKNYGDTHLYNESSNNSQRDKYNAWKSGKDSPKYYQIKRILVKIKRINKYKYEFRIYYFVALIFTSLYKDFIKSPQTSSELLNNKELQNILKNDYIKFTHLMASNI